MFEFNVMFIFSVYLYLSIVFECECAPPELQCRKKLDVPNGQARLLISGGVTIAKITCFQQYVLVNGNETMTCVSGKWDSEFPICSKIDSCHDNCGKITDSVGCSCDWKCHNNNNCCPDILIKCPYIKPMDDIARLYLTATTTAIPTTMTTSEKNKMLNVTIPKNGHIDTITIEKLYLTSTDKLSNITHFLKNTSFFDPLVKILHKTTSNSTDISPILNTTLNGLISRRSPNIDNYLNLSTFSDKNATDIFQPNSENSVIPLKHNQTLTTNAFSLNNYSGLPVVIAESTNLLENLKKNTNVMLSYVYDAIYIIGYLAAVGVILFICKHSFYFIKSFIKKPTDAKDQAFVETKNEVL